MELDGNEKYMKFQLLVYFTEVTTFNHPDHIWGDYIRSEVSAIAISSLIYTYGYQINKNGQVLLLLILDMGRDRK